MEYKNIWKKFACQKKNHEEEPLNLLCLDCKQDRIICVECLENHEKHSTLSIKKFFDSLNKNEFKDESCEKIEKNFEEIICFAKAIREKINKSIEDCLIKLEKCKIICLSNSNNTHEEITKLEAINSLDSFVNLLEEIIPKYKENLKKNPNEKIGRIIKNNSQIQNNLEVLYENCNKSLEEIEKFMLNYPLKIDNDDLFFNVKDKHEDILVFNNNLGARKININSYTTILLNKNLTNEIEFSCKIKCVNLAYWIGVGIGIKEILQQTNYLSKISTLLINNGVFLYSFNSYLWSHRVDSEFNKYLGYNIKKGEIIELKYFAYENKLIFLKNNEKIGELNKIKMDNETIYPVVVLYGKDDEVEIIKE